MSGERARDGNPRKDARGAAIFQEGSNESVTLHRGSRPAVSLDEAVDAAAKELEGAVVFLYTPGRFLMAKLQDGVVSHLGRVLNLLDVFEARLFNETYELRWLHAKAGLGRAVILSEEPLPRGWVEESPPFRFADYQRITYLLWGEAVPAAEETRTRGPVPGVSATRRPETPGWTTLYEARIGPMIVPVSCRNGGRALLVGREYLERGEFGNAAIAEERLVAIVAEESSTATGEQLDAGLEGSQ